MRIPAYQTILHFPAPVYAVGAPWILCYRLLQKHPLIRLLYSLCMGIWV